MFPLKSKIFELKHVIHRSWHRSMCLNQKYEWDIEELTYWVRKWASLQKISHWNILKECRLLRPNEVNGSVTGMGDMAAESYHLFRMSSTPQMCVRQTCHTQFVVVRGVSDLHFWKWSKLVRLVCFHGHGRYISVRLCRPEPFMLKVERRKGASVPPCQSRLIRANCICRSGKRVSYYTMILILRGLRR